MSFSAADIVNSNNNNTLSQSLGAAVSDVSSDETVTFRQYRQTVLPFDGFVFWLATPTTLSVTGSLHIETNSVHDESQRYDHSEMVLSTQDQVQSFHQKFHGTLWLACINDTLFALDGEKRHFKKAGLFHYFGSSIPSSFLSQFIHTEAELDHYSPVVSSSLPIFLQLPHAGSPTLSWCPWPQDVPMFPSFCVPDNQEPPYIILHPLAASVHAESMGTLDPESGSTSQLIRERIRVIMVGLPHLQAANIRDYILHWALLHCNELGISNSPVIQDIRHSLEAVPGISMMKSIEFDVMYNQRTVRQSAATLIEHAKMTLKNDFRAVPTP